MRHDLADITLDDIGFEALESGGDAKPDRCGFRRIVLTSRMEKEAALYAARIVAERKAFKKVFESTRCIDSDILALLGLTSTYPSDAEFPNPQAAVQAQRQHVESSLRRAADPLTRGLEKLGAILRLKEDEKRILRLAVVSTRIEGFGDLFSALSLGSIELCDAIARATGLKRMAVWKALNASRTLCSSGFFCNPRVFGSGPNPLEVNSRVCEALCAPRFEIERFLRHLVRKGAPPRLTLDEYGHVPERELLRRYLADSDARRRSGVNILLYGMPGTGKTEFVRALAAELKLDLHEVPNEDSDGDPISGNRRFSSYAVCQNVLAGRRRQLLLFDEVEDVFGSGGSGLFAEMFGERDRAPRKSWTNEVLETNPIPTIWICNNIGAMDNAYLRRFDMVVEFRAPGPAALRKVFARYFRAGDISEQCVTKLCALPALPPSQIERAARVVRSLRSKDLAQRDAEVERIVSGSLRAMDMKHTVAVATLPDHYDPAFVNADRDLDALVSGLRSGHGARICFYGPPGTGKTAFASHMGRELGRNVLVKRASDLLSPWVGVAERNIAEAFQEARDTESILVLDEADSFLRDRTGAQHSWEVTQVNELLTQMEAFEGIFVASTNLVDTLDAASLRRLDFKVKFGYLTREQRRAMLLRVAGADQPGVDEQTLARLDRLDCLTPGDFANVLRQLRITGEVVGPLQLLDLLEAEAAMKPGGKRRGIGFGA